MARPKKKPGPKRRDRKKQRVCEKKSVNSDLL